MRLKERGRSEPGCGNMGRPSSRILERREFSFLSYFFIYFQSIFKSILKNQFGSILNFSQRPLHLKNQMYQHEYTTMLLSPMINFNLMKNIIFPIFHEQKNDKLNYFSSTSKRAKFRMLQIPP